MSVYWKPKHGTRSSRHRAWVKLQARREAALAQERRAGLRAWLRRLRR